MEAAVGPLVGAVLNSVYEQVRTQAQSALNFKDQFKEMQMQLEHMHSFLKDCKGSGDKAKHETVKTAIKHLRELTYVADDVVTGCGIREDYKRSIGTTSPCCLPSFTEVVYRWDTGRKLTEINVQLQKMHGRSGSIKSSNGDQSSEPHGSSRLTKTTSLVPHKIVGLEKETEQLTNWILSRHVSFIGIAGMGGLGKTTLAQKLFNHPEVKKQFKRIWVCVSQTYNEDEIQKSILKKLGVVEDNDEGPGDLQTKISKLLLQSNYLIVLDDVWEIRGGWWNLISNGFLEAEKGNGRGCIIVTSRKKQFIRDMAAHGGFDNENVNFHEPKLLGEVESEELFCKFVFGPTKTKFTDSKLDKVGKEIVRKCNGLPLAIKTIGGVMKFIPQHPADWTAKCEKFREVITKVEGTVNVIDSLQLSYDELPDHLKQCLLCFAIYPDDHEIEVEQLKRWWAGEGFVRGFSETSNEEAYEYLLELINRCLVEVTKKRDFDGRVYRCKLHDMVREMVIRNANEEEFCDFKTGKHIATPNSLHLGVTKDTSFQALIGNEKLRALILTTYDSIGFDKQIALAKVKTLRVLDLSRLKLDGISVDDLWRWITSQKLLAYLNLQDVAGLKEIPPSIRKLWGLQVLVLEGCKYLGSLPSPMATFPRLKVLDVGNCSALVWMPRGISKLSSLQELYGFKMPKGNEQDTCRLSDLRKLKQLEVLQVDIMEGSQIQDDDLTALGSLEKLRLLSINASGIADQEILQKLEKLSVPKSVKHLYLRRFCLEATPAWISPSKLPQLQFLCIEDSKELTHFSKRFCEDQWVVEGMCLKFLPKLEVTWNWLQGAMPQLRYLEVSHCNSFKFFPFSTDDLCIWEKPREEEHKNGDEEDKEEECNTHED